MKHFNPDVNTLNWNYLRTFYVIAEERSITRAAQRLDIRQPSVSLALQRLEEDLGCQLVHRDSRSFELTSSGNLVHQECTQLYRGVNNIREITKESETEISGTLRLLVVSNLCSPIIDEAIRLIYQRNPSISWRLEVSNSDDTVREISQELCNIGLCLLTKPVVNLDCQFLFREEFAVFCGSEHSLFGTTEITLNDLQQEPFVSFTCAVNGMGFEPMVVLQSGGGLGVRVKGSSPNLEEVRRMIISGLGIGVLPIASVKNEIDQQLLWPLNITDDSIGADVYLVTNPNVELHYVENIFVDVMNELLETEKRYESFSP